MALSIAHAAAALNIGDGVNHPPEPDLTNLVRQLAAVNVLVARYSPHAPEAIVDEASARLLGWLFDSPPNGERTYYSNGLIQSGAAALLDAWRVPDLLSLDGPVGEDPITPDADALEAEIQRLRGEVDSHEIDLNAHPDIRRELTRLAGDEEAIAKRLDAALDAALDRLSRDEGAANELGRRITGVADSVKELQTRSDAGDDLQVIEVGTAAQYAMDAAAQRDSDQPLRMVITADIQVDIGRGVMQAYTEGEVLEFAPRSDRPEASFSLPLHWRDHLNHLSDSASTEAEWNAKVAAHANVRTHLWLRVSRRFFATIAGNRRAREVGELYHLPPRSITPMFIADTSTQQEVLDAINNAFVQGISLWARPGGQNVDGQGKQVYPLAGVFAPGFDNGYSLRTDGRGRLSWVAPPTAQQLAGQTNFTIEPGTVSRGGIAGNYTLFHDDVSRLGAAVYAAVQTPAGTLDRQRLNARGGSIDFALDAAAARFIDNGTAAGSSSFGVKVQLYAAAAGGIPIATITLGVGLAR